MPIYNIEFTASAARTYDKLFRSQRSIAEHILKAIEELKTQPTLGKKLMGELKDYRSLRVGDYRIIYIIIEHKILIEIVNIGHRREIYR